MWTRLDDTKLRNASKSTEEREGRTYGQDGKPWPRICVEVGKSPHDPNGYAVSFSRKNGPGAWWYSHIGLPLEILQDLPDLIQAYLKRCA